MSKPFFVFCARFRHGLEAPQLRSVFPSEKLNSMFVEIDEKKEAAGLSLQ